MKPKRDYREELAFLPAALEIQETPPSPVGRTILWTIIGILVATVAWASLGHVDIVAVAPGKIVPSSRVKVIQSLGIGSVRAIHVTDGQEVRAGDPLIELDPTLAEADRERATGDLEATELELARQRAFAGWLANGRARPLVVSAATGEGERRAIASQQALLDQSIAEHRARLVTFDRSLERRQAELDATRSTLEKLKRTLPIIQDRAPTFEDIAAKGLVAKKDALELEQQRIEAEQDLTTQEAVLRSTQAAIEELAAERNSLNAEARRMALQSVEELSVRLAQLSQESVKAERIATQQVLTAPVDGVVQQLAVHTLAGVVTPAEPLMIIVPKEQALEVEARLLNKDIGFVCEGQAATIKVESFPFTRYGTLTGKVTAVSRDAMADEALGLVFATRVQLERASLNIDGIDVRMTSGMAVSVEIKTGDRRILDYFLSPVLQAADEGIRER
jgi:hemolysin D